MRVVEEEEENLFRQTNNIIRDNNVQQYGRLPEEA